MSAVTIIQAVCEERNAAGFTSRPRIVKQDSYDLSSFHKRKSSFPGVAQEFVYQPEPGVMYDDYPEILAVPIGNDLLFVVSCDR